MNLNKKNKIKQIFIAVNGFLFLGMLLSVIYFIFDLMNHGGLNEIDKTTLKNIFILSVSTFFVAILYVALFFHQEKMNFHFSKKALTDKLTGAFNREYLDYLFKKEKIDDYIFVLLDIDHFKMINDTYGHNIGDIVLQKMSATIQKTIRDKDKFIRLGGEEFLILLDRESIGSKENLDSFAERIRSTIKHIKFKDDNHNEFTITVSFGINNIPEKCSDLVQAIDYSDKALYKAKINRDQIVYFDEKALKDEQIDLNKILELINRNNLVCFYQPIFNLYDGLLVKYEALIRIKDNGEYRAPMTFLNLIQKDSDKIFVSKKIIDYNIDVLRKNKGMNVSINLFLEDILFNEVLEHLLSVAALNPEATKRMSIEISEDEKGTYSFQAVQKMLKVLTKSGYKIIIDNFNHYNSFLLMCGSEYIDELKISPVVVKSLNSKKNNTYDYIGGVVCFCKKMNIKVSANHIESQLIEQKLIELGVHYGQGFYLGKLIQKI